MAGFIRKIVKSIPGARKLYFKHHYQQYLNELRKQPAIGCGKKVLIINHHFDQDIEALMTFPQSLNQY